MALCPGSRWSGNTRAGGTRVDNSHDDATSPRRVPPELEGQRPLLLRGIGEKSDGPPGGRRGTLARNLIAAGKLTPFQAAAVRERQFEELVIGNYDVLDRLGPAAWARSSRPGTAA